MLYLKNTHKETYFTGNTLQIPFHWFFFLKVYELFKCRWKERINKEFPKMHSHRAPILLLRSSLGLSYPNSFTIHMFSQLSGIHWKSSEIS